MFPKIGGKHPKMDGSFHGKPYFLMDDLEVPLFVETPIYTDSLHFRYQQPGSSQLYTSFGPMTVTFEKGLL